MSVELLLLPGAIAGFSALMERARANRNVCTVQTRLKDPALLVEALTALGAEARAHADGTVEATLEEVRMRFAPNADGSLLSHFTGGEVDTARAEEIVRAVDAEYARLVQERVYRRVKERAAELNMTVESETVDQQQAITLVLNVER